jgi:hypothetical protein
MPAIATATSAAATPSAVAPASIAANVYAASIIKKARPNADAATRSASHRL